MLVLRSPSRRCRLLLSSAGLSCCSSPLTTLLLHSSPISLHVISKTRLIHADSLRHTLLLQQQMVLKDAQQHSNISLRDAFDTPHISQSLNISPYSEFVGHTSKMGLFGYLGLHHPAGFVSAAKNAVQRAQGIVDKVCAATTDDELKKTTKRLDTLSDILCCVVDTAEVIRNVHPDKEFVNAANQAHSILSNYLNQLNTHQGLYKTLKQTLDRSNIVDAMSEEEKRVAKLLMIDFEKSGIHMPDATRAEFVRINDRILELGQEFTMNSFPSEEFVQFDDAHNDLIGVPIPLVDALCRASSRAKRGSQSESSNRPARAIVPTSSDIASTILRTAHKEETRKRIYLAMNSASSHQISVLEEMLTCRADLARLLGKPSYGHVYLIDKMAESPEKVKSFLETLSYANRPLCDNEYNRLNDIKRVHTGRSEGIRGWDRSYYTQFLTRPTYETTHPSSSTPTPLRSGATSLRLNSLSSYYSVGSTLQGLSDVFNMLYGVRLEPSQVLQGETWHPDVRKLDVVHETEGKLGTIYCDLFSRESGGGRKYESAAHFTVRCSRRIDNDYDHYEPNFDTMSNPNNEQIVYHSQGKSSKLYQLPIIVLVTSFQRPQEGRPGLLELHDIQTLFHEMGHAMHSMLAKTDYQHIAGTRVAMDFVEVPSILMELFAKSPQVLAKFGQHYQTGDPIPMDLLEAQCLHLLTLEALETQQQLKMALLDQLYHSPLAMSKSTFNTTSILEDLQNSMFPIAFAPGTHWQIQFSHLFGYSASYYSYMWSRRWASRIYHKLFHGKPMEEWRAGGEEFRQQVLRWGGGRDPWIGLQHIGVVKEGERDGHGSGDVNDLY
ncbi:Mitochondrial intermediate peptidase [Batrachochytrium dendrobatidis]|nr:Mitochondrial intermediate peptidase [Batrachochytrium dendrobatidis]KAK5670819.1 Mitochondrial intermediate peptidase [Batrachochytrium dendrobatidis]